MHTVRIIIKRIKRRKSCIYRYAEFFCLEIFIPGLWKESLLSAFCNSLPEQDKNHFLFY